MLMISFMEYTESFNKEVTHKLANIFEMGKTESGNFKYVGFNIRQDPDSQGHSQ